MLYDGYGNAIPSIHGVTNTSTTLFGPDLPDDISGYGVSQTYADTMKQCIIDWASEYAGDDQKVPFIVHTDQHGNLTIQRQGLFNLLSSIVNWDEVSAIFNLGDTVYDHWSNDDIDSDPLLRNNELENALVCLSGLPSNKRIEIAGNHDTWYRSPDSSDNTFLPDRKYINPYFKTTGLRVVKNPDNSSFMEVFDDRYRIRYLIIAGWDYEDRPDGHVGYPWFWINQKHWDWIIEKMTENTGYDLVIISHVPLMMGSSIAYDPVSNTSKSMTNPIYIIHFLSFHTPFWNARKNKTSGILSNNYGLHIEYDFSSCTDNLLCALAGHTHWDGVDYIRGDSSGLLQIAFDYFQNNTIHFGLIDRKNEQIVCYKLSNDSDTPSYVRWVAPFNYQN